MSAKVHFENFDALRFFAFLVVFVSHIAVFLGFVGPKFAPFSHTWLAHGDLGVSFFFVLSGFLITHLLISEKKEGGISLPHFYTRRVLRIWPVYFIVFIIGFFIIPHLALENFPFMVNSDTTSPWWFVFFLANVKLALSYAPPAILAVLWSISVEEQFYLIWPLIMKKILRKELIVLLIAVIISCTWYRFVNSDNYGAVHYFTLSVFSDIAIGSLVALLISSRNTIVTWFEKLPRPVIIATYLTLIALVPLRTLYPAINSAGMVSFLTAIEPIVFACLFAFVLMEQTYSHHSLWKVGKTKLFTNLGKISYGLYAYHMIAFFVVITLLNVLFNIPLSSPSILWFIIKITLSFVITIFIAKLSYRFIEAPFLHLKNKFGYKKKELPEEATFRN